MKVLIVSDTHGRHSGLEKIIEKVGIIDLMIHLGDVEGGENYIRSLVDCEVHMVKGNNDYFSDLPGEKEIQIGRLKAFITHGHRYYVSLEYEKIRAEGIARGMDIVMFGHTHRPYLDEGHGITVLNPGSVSYPRQVGKQGSYMLMEIDGNGNVKYSQQYLEDI